MAVGRLPCGGRCGGVAGCGPSSANLWGDLGGSLPAPGGQHSFDLVCPGIDRTLFPARELGIEMFVAILRPGVGSWAVYVSFSCGHADLQRVECLRERISALERSI